MPRKPQVDSIDSHAAAALSDAVRAGRADRGWSQQRLADRSGVSIGTVRAIETGRVKDPGVFTVRRIADAFGESLDRLLRYESRHST